ncbi:MAG: repressor LexA [Chloroflexi bacterium RBG_16_57_9]|nr:MAG: repressor LexA [Chloroflexi bacterium RBG_16_57_9]
MSPELSRHENLMLQAIERYITHKGRAPTVEEIRLAVNLPSKDHVHRDLRKIEAKGYIEREPRVSRGIRLLKTADGGHYGRGMISIPIYGRIAAGEPIPTPDERISAGAYEMLELTRDIVKDSTDVYALRVKGNSMIDALIHDGDLVILKHQVRVENGEMAAVWLSDREETTLKRFYHEGHRIRLQPENKTMEPMYFHPRNVQVQGKVIAVIRHT